MSRQGEIEKAYGVATAGASSPGEWPAPIRDGPAQDPGGFARYWQRRAEGAELRAHDEEERALIAERRSDEQRERAEEAERRVEGLEHGLTSRETIDQAKGVIMGVFGLSSDPAFDVLVWVSQHSNVKVKTICERFLAEIHELDLGHRPREKLTRTLATLAGVQASGTRQPSTPCPGPIP